MTTTLLWLLVVVLIVAGLAGTVLPALPGTLLVLAGIVLGAWIDDFTRVGGLTLARGDGAGRAGLGAGLRGRPARRARPVPAGRP